MAMTIGLIRNREATRRKKSGLSDYVTGQKNLSHNRKLQKTEKN